MSRWNITGTRFMKKIMLLFALVVSMAIFAQGVGFRSNQSLCNGNEQVILKTDHTVEIWGNNMLVYSGTWERDGNVIIMTLEGAKIRCQIIIGSDANIHKLTFNDTNYYPCKR